jgi:glucose-6-phosphate isomerase
MFFDQVAVKADLASGNPLVYDIRYYHFITSTSDMSLGVTRIFPGKIGDEYYMTKGHFHERDDQPEIYFCIRGQGYLLMESAAGDFHAHPWRPGVITHIPPFYAHRVVNTSGETLIFVASYHVSAGHNYAPVVQRGFAQVVVERAGRPEMLPNPRR